MREVEERKRESKRSSERKRERENGSENFLAHFERTYISSKIVKSSVDLSIRQTFILPVHLRGAKLKISFIPMV